MSTTGSPPVRYTSGVSTSPVGYVFSEFPFPTPPRLNCFFDDFNVYDANDWTVTATTGSSALADANGGKLTLTTAASTNDVQGNQLVKKSFAFTSGSQVWFSINVSFTTTATTNAFMAGLSNDFSALAPTDGVYFSKAAGSTTMNCIIRASSTSTTLAVGTVAAGQAYTFSFYYDGKPTPTLKVYSTIGYSGSPTAFSVPYFSGGNQEVISASSETGATNTLVNLPAASTLLTAGFAYKAGNTIAGVAVIDYMLAAEEIIGRF